MVRFTEISPTNPSPAIPQRDGLSTCSNVSIQGLCIEHFSLFLPLLLLCLDQVAESMFSPQIQGPIKEKDGRVRHIKGVGEQTREELSLGKLIFICRQLIKIVVNAVCFN